MKVDFHLKVGRLETDNSEKIVSNDNQLTSRMMMSMNKQIKQRESLENEKLHTHYTI